MIVATNCTPFRRSFFTQQFYVEKDSA
jgi:hypothetical protein